MVDAYTQSGALPERTPLLTEKGIAVYADVEGDDNLESALVQFPGSGQCTVIMSLCRLISRLIRKPMLILQAMRLKLRDRLRLATTVGYGPRFLHSTGQLHKGDGGNGLFIQITSDAADDVAIP